MKEKNGKVLLCICFAMYLAALLWITLLSRMGDYHKSVAVPFRSFTEIAKGNRNSLIETLENIVLFIPFGFFCRRLFGIGRKQTILLGLLTSVLIESTQLICGLGTFEVDDLITNTLGTVVGSIVPQKRRRIEKKDVLIVCGVMIMASSIPLLYGTIQYRKMETLAANGDREGKKNLLVLNGQPGFVGKTDIYVKYNSDGSIEISGTADHRAWKVIGQMMLEPGTYSFSGLSGTEKNTIAIELEYYNEEQMNFIRLTPDIGPIDEAIFTFDKATRIKAYVGVYAGASDNVTARPVIYREDY